MTRLSDAELAAMRGHTPGDWSVGRPTEFGIFNPNQVYVDNTDNAVAQVYGIPMHTQLEHVDERFAEGLTNARLISSAPALLAEVLERRAQDAKVREVFDCMLRAVNDLRVSASSHKYAQSWIESWAKYLLADGLAPSNLGVRDIANALAALKESQR